MRTIVLFLLSIAYTLSSAAKDETLLRNKSLCDSVIGELRAMPQDTNRLIRAHELFALYQHQEWSKVLADFVDRDAKALATARGHKLAAYDLYCYAYNWGTSIDVKRALNQLKTACYAANDPNVYFRAWSVVLNRRSMQGDYEAVLQETKLMGKEALRIGFKHGMVSALIVEADVYRNKNDWQIADSLYTKALEMKGLKPQEELGIYSMLSLCKREQGETELFLVYTRQMKLLAVELMNEETTKVGREWWYDWCLLTEQRFAQYYYLKGNLPMMKKHLLESNKYCSDKTFLDYLRSQYETWACYYRGIKQWDKCLALADSMLNVHRSMGDTASLMWTVSVMEKATFLQEAGRINESLDLREYVSRLTASMNEELLKRQETVLMENQHISIALIEKEMLERKRYITCIVFLFFFLIFVLIFVFRSYITRQTLKRERKMVEDAMNIALRNDKLKEIFLRNITKRINKPLNEVLFYAEKLSVEENLSEKELSECSMKIKNSADTLTELVNSVLHLSRLEAGMMKYEVDTEADLVILCETAKQIVEFKKQNVIVSFMAEVATVHLPMDKEWCTKMMVGLFAAAHDASNTSVIECRLWEDEENIVIEVVGSLMAEKPDDADIEIQNKINMLFVKDFGGTYCCRDKRITITFPK